MNAWEGRRVVIVDPGSKFHNRKGIVQFVVRHKEDPDVVFVKTIVEEPCQQSWLKPMHKKQLRVI